MKKEVGHASFGPLPNWFLGPKIIGIVNWVITVTKLFVIEKFSLQTIPLNRFVKQHLKVVSKRRRQNIKNRSSQHLFKSIPIFNLHFFHFDNIIFWESTPFKGSSPFLGAKSCWIRGAFTFLHFPFVFQLLKAVYKLEVLNECLVTLFCQVLLSGQEVTLLFAKRIELSFWKLQLADTNSVWILKNMQSLKGACLSSGEEAEAEEVQGSFVAQYFGLWQP